jgi:hypothetical protein
MTQQVDAACLSGLPEAVALRKYSRTGAQANKAVYTRVSL